MPNGCRPTPNACAVRLRRAWTGTDHMYRSTGQRGRLLSLDVFRGVAVAGVILVSHPSVFHSVWPQQAVVPCNGWTAAVLVFPAFLFIVGVAIALSLAPWKRPEVRRAPIVGGIILRTLALFGLGLFLNAFPTFHLATLRIPGVLQ